MAAEIRLGALSEVIGITPALPRHHLRAPNRTVLGLV